MKVGRMVRLVQFDDVGVVETLHHLDFVLEEVHVLHELLVDRLDRADSPGCFVLAFLHLSVRSFPDDFLAHGVLARELADVAADEGAHREAAALALVERFDIEPFPDFSVK